MLLSYHFPDRVYGGGVGMGTQMGINGAASHALCHIIYNALLYMGAGCVLVVAGTAKFNRLGGLYKYMPIAFWLYMIGGFSISGSSGPTFLEHFRWNWGNLDFFSPWRQTR